MYLSLIKWIYYKLINCTLIYYFKNYKYTYIIFGFSFLFFWANVYCGQIFNSHIQKAFTFQYFCVTFQTCNVFFLMYSIKVILNVCIPLLYFWISCLIFFSFYSLCHFYIHLHASSISQFLVLSQPSQV